MKVLSLWQPWATLVVIGAKAFETRGWRPPQGVIGQRIAIHATKSEDGAARRLCMAEPFLSALRLVYGDDYQGDDRALPRGVILGSVLLVSAKPTEEVRSWLSKMDRGKRELQFGNYSDGRVAWRLDARRVLNEPIPAKGMQRLWNWDPPGGMAL